ncbi:MAG: hypothetical protein V2A79_00965, partial [Planctomycetota bacterium]
PTQRAKAGQRADDEGHRSNQVDGAAEPAGDPSGIALLEDRHARPDAYGKPAQADTDREGDPQMDQALENASVKPSSPLIAGRRTVAAEVAYPNWDAGRPEASNVRRSALHSAHAKNPARSIGKKCHP